MVAFPNQPKERDDGNSPRREKPGEVLLEGLMRAFAALTAVVASLDSTEKKGAFAKANELQRKMEPHIVAMATCDWNELRIITKQSLELFLEELQCP